MCDGEAQGTARNGSPAKSRRKASFTKSRSRAGCLTCKQKHTKCDETKPSCRRCLRKGLVCRGYSQGLKWSYKHQPDRVEAAAEQSPSVTDTAESDRSELLQLDAQESEAAAADVVACLTGFEFGDSHDNVFLEGIELPSPNAPRLTGWSTVGDVQGSFDQPTLVRTALSPASVSDLGQTPASNLELVLHIPRSPSPDGAPDTALRLISSWFEEVCPAWSGFDSSMNMNRRLATDLWHSSAAVFNALQSMSASFLSARLPQMRRPAMNLLNTATICIQSEVNALNEKGNVDAMPTGLLFSLFCLGTTICWLDASRVGAPFLREAKTLLQRFPQQNLSDWDQLETFSYFEKSLVYWEMLLSVVEDGPEADALLHGHQQLAPSIGGSASTDIVLHPWTGISSLTSQLFSQSIRLCRTYRRRITNPTGRAISLSAAMQEIEESMKLEEQLLELNFSSIPQINETGDCKTPWFHLANVAEAYQIAALLQLYVTFPDLVSLRLPGESHHDQEGHVPWDKWIIPLALRLIKVLEQIPPDSGSRVMQPLLYICASTGLRYNLSTSTNDGPHNMGPETSSGASSIGGHGIDILGYIGQIGATQGIGSSPTPVPQAALDIGEGRNFIMRRLKVLETNLQPKPIVVAQELVQAIWAAYDGEPPGHTAVHWLDVMESKELRSLFG